ncbi:uncharacterized protein [Apostichopus japonicus]|uniref:uncharacterized protein n=1 Tax=Stichopus japonicus TaxID=307972 RepID=UPI003AB42B7B
MYGNVNEDRTIVRNNTTQDYISGREILQTQDYISGRKILQDLSGKLGGSWKSLGRFLGIGEATLYDFQYNNSTTQEAAYQMLLHWARSNGSNANIENLAEGLRRACRTDLAEFVEG